MPHLSSIYPTISCCPAADVGGDDDARDPEDDTIDLEAELADILAGSSDDDQPVSSAASASDVGDDVPPHIVCGPDVHRVEAAIADHRLESPLLLEGDIVAMGIDDVVAGARDDDTSVDATSSDDTTSSSDSSDTSGGDDPDSVGDRFVSRRIRFATFVCVIHALPCVTATDGHTDRHV